MSMMRCDACDRLVDTDYYVEGWQKDDSFLCSGCVEKYSCAECGESVGTVAEREAQVSYCYPCNARIAKEEYESELLDDPRHEPYRNLKR
jgi:hypothetical protein